MDAKEWSAKLSSVKRAEVDWIIIDVLVNAEATIAANAPGRPRHFLNGAVQELSISVTALKKTLGIKE